MYKYIYMLLIGQKILLLPASKNRTENRLKEFERYTVDIN